MQINPKDISNLKGFHKLVLTIDKTFKIKDIPKLRKQIKISIKTITKSFNEIKLLEFMKNEIKIFHEVKALHTILPSKSHSLKSHKFDWFKVFGFTLKDAQELRLIKCAAMTAGEAKRGEIMTDENVIFATGAMSAAAMNGSAKIDIDHHAESLPKDEYSKYPVDKINAIYPPATIIDAAAVKNEIGKNKTPRIQTECVAICENETVYKMIQENKFIGCSVIDTFRNETCSCDDSDNCTCTVEGSHFFTNTLVLEGVPNSEGTWVQTVDKNDVGTMLVSDSNILTAKQKHQKHLFLNILKQKHHLTKTKNKVNESDLSKYQDKDGAWLDGVNSITSFLIEEKEIDEAKAKEIAAYLFDNPNQYNVLQLTFLSSDDIIEMFEHLSTNISKPKKVNKLTKSKHTIPKAPKRHFVPFGQTEVNYGDREPGSQCSDCRYASLYDNPDTGIKEGYCAIVGGDILGPKGCDKFEANPEGGTSDPPTENAEAVPLNDDDTCDEGFEKKEIDGTMMCVPIEDEEETENAEVIEPDEEGNCPEGYELQTVNEVPVCVLIETELENAEAVPLNDDDTCDEGFEKKEIDGTMMCVPIEDEDLTEEQKEEMLNSPKKKSSVIQEAHPTTTHNDKIIQINKEINLLKKELRKYKFILGRSRKSMDLMAKRMSLKKQIDTLEQKKRNFL